MSAQGLEVIDRTVQVTHEWVNELAVRLDWADRKQVLHLLRATLTALRDALPAAEAADFAAQLPILLRGMYYEGWRPGAAQEAERSLEAFVTRVSAQLKNDLEYEGEADVVQVFRLFNNRVSEGEVGDVRQALPADLRELWPEP